MPANHGEVIGIYITATPAAPLQAVDSVTAVPGCGLEGDRYCSSSPNYARKDKPRKSGTEATLIESEALEGLEREYGIQLDPSESRRNIVTRGIALNHLVGERFHVGTVQLMGMRLCEPCSHLEGLTREGVCKGLVHRGGLRCEILTAGVISVGDPVMLDQPARAMA